MSRELPRTSLTSSRLVRLLTELTESPAAESRQTFAERLSQWLQLNDAIALSGIVNARLTPAAAPDTAPQALAELQASLARLRQRQAEAQNPEGVFKPGQGRVKLPTLAAGTVSEGESPFAFFHRYYLAQQRSMEAAIAPLRQQTRESVMRHAPALRQVAALDALLEKTLAERERQLLAAIPRLLEKRFTQLCQPPAADPAAAATATDTAAAEAALAAFIREMQQVLLAELEVRLEPVQGLIDAFGNEVKQTP